MKTNATPFRPRSRAAPARGPARSVVSPETSRLAGPLLQARLLAPARRGTDPFEDEAEALADWLCDRGSLPADAPPSISSVRDRAGTWGIAPAPDLAARVNAARASGGTPLEPGLRADFEAALGVDLAHVRVHRDATSARLAAEARAHAFTTGAHVFLGAGASRAPVADQRHLLAHEIVHAIQQTQPSHSSPASHSSHHRAIPAPTPTPHLQLSFDHTSADLDPKVAILLDLHLRNRGGKLKDAGDELARSGSWLADLRAALEPPATPSGAPADAKARAKLVTSQLATAETRIRSHASTSKDAAVQREANQVQNALAGLVVDYLQFNDAPAEAAGFLVRFPYARTALHTLETAEALAAREDFEARLAPLIQGQWKIARAGAKTGSTWKEDWYEDIAAVFDEFLALPPLPEHREKRQALAARLNQPLGLAVPPARRLSASAFGALDASLEPRDSLLVALATHGLTLTRTLAGAFLGSILKGETDSSGKGPFHLWDDAVAKVGHFARVLGATQSSSQLLAAKQASDPSLQPVDQRDYALAGRAMLAAEKSNLPGKASLADALRLAVQPHLDFWQRIGELGGSEFDPARHPELAQRLADSGHASLGPYFFSAHAHQMARAVANTIPDLRDHLADYFKDGVAPVQDADPSTRHPGAVFAHHRDAAEFLRADLGFLLEPIVRALALARAANDAELVDALGWFGVQLAAGQNLLGGIPANPSTGSEPAVLIAHIEGYGRVAQLFGHLARAALGRSPDDPATATATTSGSATPTPVPQQKTWQDIEALCIQAEQLEFVRTSLLVVTRPLEPSSDSKPDRLAKDAGGGVIQGLEPFTGRELSLFYQADYQRRLADQLAELSDAAEAAAEPRTTEDLWLVGKAVASVKEATGPDALPKRYESPDAYWVRYPGDPLGTLGVLFRASTPFLEWERGWSEQYDDDPRRKNLALRDSAELRPELNVWDLPMPGGLVEQLHSLPVLRGIVAMGPAEFEPHAAALRLPPASAPAAPSTAPSISPPDSAPLDAALLAEFLRVATAIGEQLPPETLADPWAWYLALRERLDHIRPGAAGGILGQESLRAFAADGAASDLRAQRARAMARTHQEMRRATTLDRGVIRRKNQELLEGAIDEHIAQMGNIGEAFDNIAAFHGAVSPRTEREQTLQTAALVLELLPLLLEIFGEDDPIGSYKDDAYYFLSLARNSLDELLARRPADEPDPATSPGDSSLEKHSEGIQWTYEYERIAHADARNTRDADIAALLDKLTAQLAPLQWELSISADASKGFLYSHLGDANWAVPTVPVIEERNKQHAADDEDPEPDFIDFGGFQVRILQILESFTFLPGIGDRERASNPKARGGARYVPAQLFVGQAFSSRSEFQGSSLAPRGTENPVKDPPATLDGPDVPLVRVQVNQGGQPISEPFDIMASDFGTTTSGLDWLAHLVHGRALQLNFEQLGKAVDAYGQLLLFAASFHPVGAAVITAAEIGLLVTDTQLKEQLKALADDPRETLERFATEFTRVFEPDALFDLALNGNFEAPAFARHTAGKAGRKAFGGKTVARILARVRRIAGAVALRLDAFQEAAQRPIRAAQGELAEHPRLAAVTHWAGEKIEASTDLEGLILRHPVAGPVYESYVRYRRLKDAGADGQAFSSLAEPVGQLATGIHEGLEAMKKVELPATLIPLPLALDALVELLLLAAKRGKGRLRIAAALADALKKGADASGISKYLYAHFSEWIQEVGADPNQLWQKTILPPLQDQLAATVGDAAERLESVVRRTPLLGDYLGEGRYAADARRQGQRVEMPATDGAGSTVTASEDHDGVFDHPILAEWAPETPAEDATSVPSYATISKMPDVFFDHLKKKPNPADGAAVPDAGGASQNAQPPEASPNPDPTAPDPADSDAGLPRPSTLSSRGDPLPRDLRSSAQSRFGHDFSHVRLHRGSAADTLTSQAGARALTSGSHIFLGRGLDPASGTGSRVLQHELAHVLQKQGPRPLGQPHPARPSLGAPHGGLRWSPSEERAADHMAGRAGSRSAGRAVPVPVLGAHRSGFSPSIKGELIGEFLERISSPGTGASLAKRAEQAHARAAVANLEDHVGAAASHLWGLLAQSLRNAKVSADAPFDTSKALILAHLDDRLATLRESGTPTQAQAQTQASIPAVSKVIDHLAAGRQIDDPSAPRKSTPGKATPKPQILDAKGFLVDLGLYLAARSGVVLDFDPPRNINGTLKNNASAQVAVDIRIRHLELHFVNSRSDNGRAIWTKAIQNSWPTAKNVDRHWDVIQRTLTRRFGAPPPAVANSSTPGAAPPSKEDRLASGGFQPIWDAGASELRFNKTFIQDIEVELNPPHVGPDLMAPWPIYVGRDRAKKYGADSVNQATADLRQDKHFKGTTPDRTARIGLHLATHGDFTNGDYDLKNNDRESHHVVQYLLPEYFSNAKDSFKPFPDLPSKKYPGVVAKGTGVQQIGTKADGSGEPIEIADTEGPGRGNPMPAILLSARAHQNSGLHVTPQPDDKGSASQGLAIHLKFEEFLHQEVKKVAPATPTPAAALAYVQARPTEDAAAQKVHAAVQRTAGWLWNVEMKNALLKTMPDVEASYYLGQFNLAPGTGAGTTGSGGKSPLLAQLHGGTEPDHATIQSALATRAQEAATWVIDQLTSTKGWKFPA